MKNVTTLLMCMLCIITGFAQSDSSGNKSITAERTPELEALYQQASHLENDGTAAEINAHRLAIKNAWQQVDPTVSALYKPIETENANLPIMTEGSYVESIAPEDWDIDGLLRDGFIDGLDMSVTQSGDIYITAIENYIGAGDANMYIYKSTDNGNSFELWKSDVFTNSTLNKIKTISIDGSGDDYLLVYILDDASLFFATRINMATKASEVDIVSTDVTDFAVDRNYPGATSSQRVYATYLKEDSGCTEGDLLYSARSTVGSFGFDWVDETSLGTCVKQVDFAYGRDGGSYTTFVGGVSGSLYAKFNPNSNDPASWEANETIVNGSDLESLNPSIKAARKTPSTDRVVIFTSSRPSGATGHYDAKGYKRENGGSFALFSDFAAGGSGAWSIMQPNGWIKNSNDAETIRFVYTRVSTGAVENNANRSLTFNGSDFDPLEPVSDASTDVFEGYPAAIAETSDGLPCMAFAGTDTNSGLSYGYGLFFDRKSDVVGLEENGIEGLALYPNPTQDVLNISSKSAVENVLISSLLGQEVMQVSPEQKNPSINISMLTAGVYIMKVEVDGQIGTYKIIKK